MLPTDPRHGTYAGFQAHHKIPETPCEPCKVAQRRYFKQMKLRLHRGQRTRVVLGQDAWDIIDSTIRTTLSRATGLRVDYLCRLHTAGPNKGVYVRTRDRILAARSVYTPIGIQRRLRALAALGWSYAALSRESGVTSTALGDIAGKDTPPAFVRSNIAEAINATYDRLSMKSPTASRSVTAVRNRARVRGWVTPLCWDEDRIDDPDAKPLGARNGNRRGYSGSLLEEWEHLRTLGVSLHEAARQLGVTVGAIEKALQRREVAS